MNSFEWIWQYAKKNKNKLLLAVIFVVINAILIVIIPLLSGRIVDQVINQGKTEELGPNSWDYDWSDRYSDSCSL